MKIQPFFVFLICKTLRFGWYCLSSLMILIGVLNFGSIPEAACAVLFLVILEPNSDDLSEAFSDE